MKIKKGKTGKESNKPKRWIIAILTPIIVGVVITIITVIIQKTTETKYGELYIDCNINDATILLNKDNKGLTSSKEATKIDGLKPGNYILFVQKKGYYTSPFTDVIIAKGEITSKKVELTPIPKKKPIRTINTDVDPIPKPPVPQPSFALLNGIKIKIIYYRPTRKKALKLSEILKSSGAFVDMDERLEGQIFEKTNIIHYSSYHKNRAELAANIIKSYGNFRLDVLSVMGKHEIKITLLN